ncbi:pectate lyase [Kitasatospora sp. NPDC004240]
MSKRAIRPRRGRIAALGGVVALVAAGVGGGLWAGANAAAPTPRPGAYTLVSAAGGQCLNAPTAPDADGAGDDGQLRQEPCGGERQVWHLAAAGDALTLTAADGNCAAVRDARTGAGAPVQLEPCRTGAPAQRWTAKAVDGGYRLVNAGSGKCLAVKDGSAAAGTPVQQNSCDSAAGKRWQLKPAATTPDPTGAPTATPTAAPTTTAPTVPTGAVPAWPTPKGDDVPLTATRTVDKLFDGGGRRFVGRGALGSGSQSENQPPMFELTDGAVLQNVILGDPAADGVHCTGTCTLRNVWWENVGEDAATFRGTSPAQTMTVDGGGARGASDKVFQHNGPGTFVIKNFRVEDFGKLYRSCGNCKTQYPRHVVIDNVIAGGPGKALVGINANLGDSAKISRLTITGDAERRIAVCKRYEGVTKGEPKETGSGPDGTHCRYTPADVTYRP